MMAIHDELRNVPPEKLVVDGVSKWFRRAAPRCTRWTTFR